MKNVRKCNSEKNDISDLLSFVIALTGPAYYKIHSQKLEVFEKLLQKNASELKFITPSYSLSKLGSANGCMLLETSKLQ